MLCALTSARRIGEACRVAGKETYFNFCMSNTDQDVYSCIRAGQRGSWTRFIQTHSRDQQHLVLVTASLLILLYMSVFLFRTKMFWNWIKCLVNHSHSHFSLFSPPCCFCYIFLPPAPSPQLIYLLIFPPSFLLRLKMTNVFSSTAFCYSICAPAGLESNRPTDLSFFVANYISCWLLTAQHKSRLWLLFCLP